MKRITAIGLVLLLSLPGLHNLGVITYFQMNRDYIAEVLCINRDKPMTVCNGQCFLQQNLDMADTTSDDQSVPSGKERLEFSIFLITDYVHPIKGVDSSDNGNSPYFGGLSSAHLLSPFHPPSLS